MPSDDLVAMDILLGDAAAAYTEFEPEIHLGHHFPKGLEGAPTGQWITLVAGVQPGQPLAVVWRFSAGDLDVGSSVVAEIRWGADVLYHEEFVFSTAKHIDLQYPSLGLTSEVAKRFYKLGSTQYIELRVTGSGPHAGPYVARLGFIVVSPVFFSTADLFHQWWFEWKAPPSHAFWKELYDLHGEFVNVAPFTTFQHVGVRLLEDGVNSHGGSVQEQTLRGQYDFMGMDPGEKLPHTFSIPEKDWDWRLKWPPYAVEAVAKSRQFRYAVCVTLNDAYGNSYGEVCLPGPNVDVSVSPKKEGCAQQAQASYIAATGFSVASIFCWPCAGAAVAAYAYAVIMAGKADDPPELDPNFMDTVLVEEPSLPPVGQNGQGELFDELMRKFSHLANADTALTAIHGKLLGAQAAASQEGVELQRARYREVQEQLVEDFRGADRLARLTMRRVEEEWGASPEAFANALESTTNGLTDEMREKLAVAGMDQEGIEVLNACVVDPDIRGMLKNSGGQMPLDLMVLFLHRIVRAIEAESRILLQDVIEDQ